MPGKPAVTVVIQQGVFPDEVKAPVQYGARFKAAVVYLTQYQMLPAKRTGELLEALCGTPPSTGTVMNLIEQGRCRVEAPHRALAEALLRQPAVGADETGARVEGRLHWLHILASESLRMPSRSRSGSPSRSMCLSPSSRNDSTSRLISTQFLRF